ncbi:MAG: NADH-quinone oxidoreductase subunit L [bacterium]
MALSWIILFPLLGALLNGALALSASVRRKPTPEGLVSLIGVALPALAFAVALSLGLPFLKGAEEPVKQKLFSWIAVGNFQVEASLALDRLSVVMSLIVTGVGTLIHLYSTGYMKGDPGYARYFAYLNLFLTAMLILVLADDLLLLFVGWEGVGLCSYLLIGFWFEDPAKAYAGKKAFVVNRIGDFGFLLGVFMILAMLVPELPHALPILNFSVLKAYAPALGAVAPLIAFCLFVGATGKSAQIPLYVWLPDAMAGPTPVSALIHAATMVTAGIYMIARLHFLFDMAPQTLEIVATVGAVTALFAALIGLVQNDIKKVLAYSTVSQLGYMFLGVGVGAYSAGVFHVMTHAFFKACLFLGSGSVIHALSGEQDIQKMGGLRKAMPITFATFLVATLAIAGIPPFAGFFSKDEILWQAYSRGHTNLWILGMITAALTSFYMFRLFTLTFLGKERLTEHAKHHLHESPFNMTSVLILLALLSAGAGFLAVPQALGGHNWFHGWLGIGEAAEEIGNAGLERTLAFASAGIAALSALLATFLYLKAPQVPAAIAEKSAFLYRLLRDKFYVDEFYNAVVVRPIRWFSEKFLATEVDQGLIDGVLVNGSARFVAWVGGLVSVLQGGLANNYAFYFLLGIGGFIFFMVVR